MFVKSCVACVAVVFPEVPCRVGHLRRLLPRLIQRLPRLLPLLIQHLPQLVRVVLVRSQPKSSQLQALFFTCSQPNVLLFVSGLLPKAVFLALACSQPKVPLLVNALLHEPVAEVAVVDVGSFVRKIC